MSWTRFAAHTLLLACVGIALEVFFTAFMNRRKHGDRRLLGHSYVWMAPIYMLVYPGYWWLYPRISGWNPAFRGALYVALIFAGEYASGLALRGALGQAPWEPEYRGKRWAVGGLIRLDYAPAWFVAALVFEAAYRVLGTAP